MLRAWLYSVKRDPIHPFNFVVKTMRSREAVGAIRDRGLIMLTSSKERAEGLALRMTNVMNSARRSL